MLRVFLFNTHSNTFYLFLKNKEKIELLIKYLYIMKVWKYDHTSNKISIYIYIRMCICKYLDVQSIDQANLAS